LVGTESTCALTLEATCKPIPSPQHRSLVLMGYASADVAADQVPEIMEFGPIGLETFDRRLVDNERRKGFARRLDLLPEGDAWLLVEFGGMEKEEADEQAERLCRAPSPPSTTRSRARRAARTRSSSSRSRACASPTSATSGR